MEYTRLDRIIDVMFTTVTDVEPVLNPEGEVPLELIDEESPRIILGKSTAKKIDKVHPQGTWEFTDSRVLQQKRLEILQSVSQFISSPLIKKSRALYWSASHENWVACSISKRYTRTESYRYWYAFHPQWDEFLREGKIGLFVLGCMDESFAFCIPWNILNPLLPYLNTTKTERGTYWHIHVGEDKGGEYYLVVPKKEEDLPLTNFILKSVTQ